MIYGCGVGILRSTEMIFLFDHIFHAQPNRQRSIKWFPEMVLHQNKRSLVILFMLTKDSFPLTYIFYATKH